MNSNVAVSAAIVLQQITSTNIADLIPVITPIIAALIALVWSRIKREDTQTATQALVNQLATDLRKENRDQSDKLQKAYDDLSKQQVKFAHEITEKQTSIDSLIADLAKMRVTVKQLEDTIAHMESERRAVDAELQTERTKATKLAQDLTLARGRISELETAVAGLTVRLDARNEAHQTIVQPLLEGLSKILENAQAGQAAPTPKTEG